MQILRYDERQKIEYYRRLKFGHRDIARRLGRDHTVIGREIHRNTKDGKRYEAAAAQKLADQRATKTNHRKLEVDSVLHDYVVARLKDGWSPEQIAGRLKTNPPRELAGVVVSHEAIYDYIYAGPGRWEGLYPYLRRKQKKRRPKRGRKPQKNSIPERISIQERPTLINERLRVGDWESDTVVMRQKRGDGLSVQYERKLKLTRMHRVHDRSAGETAQAIWQTLDSLPQDLMKSITFDNGLEGSCHLTFRTSYGIETFFCDAYASWQKGGVENTNGLIREYFPRGTNLAMVTNAEIQAVEDRLNNRPRKALNFQTPNEALAQYLNPQDGALNP